jgi:hypothetical protein
MLALNTVIVVLGLMWLVGGTLAGDARSPEDRIGEIFIVPLLEWGVDFFGYWRAPFSGEVVLAFQEEGLEVGSHYPIEQEPEPNLVPRTYEEGTRFLIPPVGDFSLQPKSY